MNQYGQTFLMLVLLFSVMLSGQSNAKKWNLQERWGVNQTGIIEAITSAKEHLSFFPQDTLVFSFPAGGFEKWRRDSFEPVIACVAFIKVP